jgi:cbb3-type cytochrome oxidase subunit 3
MDLNTIRSAITLIGFIAFIGIVWWVFAPRNRAALRAASLIPFESEDNKAANHE